jgi:glycosyltransferase involved in cell wall biosynthesis|tara:strand:+ start:16636 stop:17682 length:1047 start_codon:yes stop_codon:yes gene_type:complete
MSTKLTACYFGIYKPKWARDTVLLNGLSEHGVETIYCTDSAKGFRKFPNLIKKHRKLRDKYDFILVGYLSNIVVPLARIISRKKVVYNALTSMYEGSVLDRGKFSIFSPMRYAIWIMDFLAFHSAHIVLVETEEQLKFISKMFFVPKRKLLQTWIGALNDSFHPDSGIKKRDKFTVVFRGWFLPATGMEHVLEAAKKLPDVQFLLIGRGMLKGLVKDEIKDLSNVELITEFVSDDVLREKMLSSHVMLGQFGSHPRMDRTVQNKTFEALALGMPYITRDSKSNRELLTNGLNCLYTTKDKGDLVSKILKLKGDEYLRNKLAENARKLHVEILTEKKIAEKVLGSLSPN